jgi:hypothetical protein
MTKQLTAMSARTGLFPALFNLLRHLLTEGPSAYSALLIPASAQQDSPYGPGTDRDNEQ